MAESKYSFQYCQKLVVFSEDWRSVLLARRKDEADYNGVFSFVGGKMDITDPSILGGLKREKNEEIGEQAGVTVYLDSTHNAFFRKSDGSSMILPHYLAHYVGGDIVLNESEYAEYRWVNLTELEAFEPKIPTIPEAVQWALNLKRHVGSSEFIKL